MITPRNYYRPKSLDEAVKRLQEADTLAVAGGAFALRGVEISIETIVDLQDVTELQGIHAQPDGTRIGGATKLSTVLADDNILGIIKDAVVRTIPYNIVNNASIGESLLGVPPPLELLSVLVAMGASVEHVYPPRGIKPDTAPLEKFVQNQDHPYQGVVTAIDIPNLAQNQRIYTEHVARTPNDAPIVCVAVVITFHSNSVIESCRIAIGGTSQQPILMLHMDGINQQLDSSLIEKVADFVHAEVHPIDDYRGSSDYRREMAKVLTKRALQSA